MPFARIALPLLIACAGCLRPALFPARTVPPGLWPEEPVLHGGAALNLLPPASDRSQRRPIPSFFAGASGGMKVGGAIYGGLSWLGPQHAESPPALPTFELACAWTLLEAGPLLFDAGATAALGLDALRPPVMARPLTPTPPTSANTGIGGYARGIWRASAWLDAELLALTSWRSPAAGAGLRAKFGAFEVGAQAQIPIPIGAHAGPALLLELAWRVHERHEETDANERLGRE